MAMGIRCSPVNTAPKTRKTGKHFLFSTSNSSSKSKSPGLYASSTADSGHSVANSGG
ncbi:UNVERIFIED_CONTAM: hypothetical protein Sradi_5332800 [Sesamum radiatum]|uniref:Uncharacterized protein n=1 Tax=Sesamum radiatum TaxID=300843 RepID=A0AAW2LPU7_SESRA